MADRIIKRHDTAVFPRLKALDADGVAIDLTGATVVYTLRDRATPTTLIVTRGACTLENQGLLPGQAYYPWVAGQTDVAGQYEEEWEITYPGGRKETLPVRTKVTVTILEDFDNV